MIVNKNHPQYGLHSLRGSFKRLLDRIPLFLERAGLVPLLVRNWESEY